MKIAIYIHIPFCIKKCYYNDFFTRNYSLLKNKNQIYEQFTKTLIKEIKLYHEKYPNLQIETLFFGGGTPNLLPYKYFNEICNNLFKFFKSSKTLEFSVECNPESISKNNLKCYKDWGVNRLSLSCQTFNDKILKYLGREANSKIIINSYNFTRKMNFNNINIDLIFGLINQEKNRYKKDLQQVIKLSPEHLYCYELIPNSNIINQKEKQNLKEYKLSMNYLQNQGYKMYEVSNYSKKNYECRHLLNYWQEGNYLGFGPSACGKINDKRYKNVYNFKKYINFLNKNIYPILFEEQLSINIKRTEKIMLSLRMTKGLHINSFESWIKSTKKNNKWYNNFCEKIKKYSKEGLIKKEKGFLKITPNGFYILDSILVNLI